MSDFSKPQPERTKRGEKNKQERVERQAKALRDNLRRRKDQTRGRKDEEALEQAGIDAAEEGSTD